MNADRATARTASELLHSGLTEQVIDGFYTVYNSLGSGFLEGVYELALFVELESRGLRVERQRQFRVHYRGQQVGEFRVDLLVEEAVVVEIKAANALCASHEAQLMNYLRASRLAVGLLLNFGPKPEVRRRAMTSRMPTPNT